MLCLLVLIFSAAIVSVFFFSNSCSTSLLIGCFASHVIPVLWSCSASSPSISCNRFQVNSTSRMPPVHADVVLKDNQLPSLTLALPQFIIHSRSVSPDDGLLFVQQPWAEWAPQLPPQQTRKAAWPATITGYNSGTSTRFSLRPILLSHIMYCDIYVYCVY